MYKNAIWLVFILSQLCILVSYSISVLRSNLFPLLSLSHGHSLYHSFSIFFSLSHSLILSCFHDFIYY